MIQDIQEVSRQRVWNAYIQLVQLLTSSDLVELPPGTSYRHCSSAVLLRGSLRTSGIHCSVISKAVEGGHCSLTCMEHPRHQRCQHSAQFECCQSSGEEAGGRALLGSLAYWGFVLSLDMRELRCPASPL